MYVTHIVKSAAGACASLEEQSATTNSSIERLCRFRMAWGTISASVSEDRVRFQRGPRCEFYVELCFLPSGPVHVQNPEAY